MATTDPQFGSGPEEFERLVQQADGWFRQATRRFKVPSNRGCRTVAFYMMALRHPAADKTPDSRKQAIRYGKLFLRHIAPERWQIEQWLSVASRVEPFGVWFEEYQEMAFQIDEIRKHMEALLPRLSPKRDAKPDPIRKLAGVAQQAWAEANGGRALRSPNPDAPLCRFLVPALEAIGFKRSSAAISDILRGRRRKR